MNYLNSQYLQGVWDNLRQIHFVRPSWVLLVLALFPLLAFWRSLRRALPATNLRGHSIRAVSWPRPFCALLLIGMWLSFCGVLAHPEHAVVSHTTSYETCEFNITIDDSGSMYTWDIDDPALSRIVLAWESSLYERQMEERKKYPALYPIPPKAPDAIPAGSEGKLQRFSLARYAAWQFVRSRMWSTGSELHEHGDRVSVGVFDDYVYRAYPLTDNLDIILDEIEELKNSARNGGGTNFDGPRPEDNYYNMGAFQYTINQFKADKSGAKVKTKVMIFISDGEDGIHDKRHDELVRQMLEMNIHVYLLCCGPKSNLSNSETASVRKLIQDVNPKDPAHPEFQNAVIWAGDGKQMSEAFKTIDRLEKTTVDGQSITQYESVQHQFLIAGCIFAASFVLGCTFLRLEL